MRALQHYGGRNGPYQARARDLAERLRANLIKNVYAQYEKTGYVWEQVGGGRITGQAGPRLCVVPQAPDSPLRPTLCAPCSTTTRRARARAATPLQDGVRSSSP